MTGGGICTSSGLDDVCRLAYCCGTVSANAAFLYVMEQHTRVSPAVHALRLLDSEDLVERVEDSFL